MPVETEEISPTTAVEEAERIVREARASHGSPPPPREPPDFGDYHNRPERRSWGWLNTLGVMVAMGGLLEFGKSTNGIQAGLAYAAMITGVYLAEKR